MPIIELVNLHCHKYDFDKSQCYASLDFCINTVPYTAIDEKGEINEIVGSDFYYPKDTVLFLLSKISFIWKIGDKVYVNNNAEGWKYKVTYNDIKEFEQNQQKSQNKGPNISVTIKIDEMNKKYFFDLNNSRIDELYSMVRTIHIPV